MQRPKNWAFFTKDLDRTDQRRTWRYQRSHKQTESLERIPAAASSRWDPAGSAACQEFLDGSDELVTRYRDAYGKTKQRLRHKIERRLKHAGIL